MLIALLVTLSILNLLDIITTHIALSLGAYEANPLAALIFKHTKLPGLIIVKAISIAINCAVSINYYHYHPALAISVNVAANCVYLAVTLINLSTIRKLRQPRE